MGRAAIFDGIYNLLLADQTLLNLLGPVNAQNLRLYRSFPQVQPVLSSYEPVNEGWLVLDEPAPSLRAVATQIDSAWEVIEPTFTIWTTRFSLSDEVSDRLDLSLHWTVEQQRDLTFGERLVLFTRRYSTADSYEKDIKLYKRVLTYKIEMVVEEQLA